MSKCSRVCGITDSSAATTSSTTSMPPTPASIARTNRSCPGTSTNDATTSAADRRVREAQLDGDAARLLFLEPVGSVPVRARTSELLPWSMCPAVPTMSVRIAGYRPFLPRGALPLARHGTGTRAGPRAGALRRDAAAPRPRGPARHGGPFRARPRRPARSGAGRGRCARPARGPCHPGGTILFVRSPTSTRACSSNR